MRGAALRYLLLTLCLLAGAPLSGCATPRQSARPSVIVLLPEGDRPSGVVTVSNAGGTQVLNQSWQSVQISGDRGGPSTPVLLEQKAVRGAFSPVLAAMPAAPVHFLLYFRLDSADILPQSQALLPEIVKVLRERAPAQLAVVGHTDAIGSVPHNYRLGLRRAAAVVEQLASLGAAPASTETSSRGKADQQVKTPDQTPEPLNRRAEVTVR